MGNILHSTRPQPELIVAMAVTAQRGLTVRGTSHIVPDPLANCTVGMLDNLVNGCEPER